MLQVQVSILFLNAVLQHLAVRLLVQLILQMDGLAQLQKLAVQIHYILAQGIVRMVELLGRGIILLE
ncbi:MAG: hypothetical protein EB124_12325 [Betaproteobacteria bacterium]|nr:hypothetical protein [Betaproteobacteria bacterium]